MKSDGSPERGDLLDIRGSQLKGRPINTEGHTASSPPDDDGDDEDNCAHDVKYLLNIHPTCPRRSTLNPHLPLNLPSLQVSAHSHLIPPPSYLLPPREREAVLRPIFMQTIHVLYKTKLQVKTRNSTFPMAR